MTADPGAHRTRSFIRAHALRAINVAVFAALIALLYRQIDIDELRMAIGDVDLWFVAAAFLLNVPITTLYVVRSHGVLVRLGHRVERHVLVPAMILGNVAGSLTPGSSGEILRAAALRGHSQIPAADGAALVLFERGVSLYMMALCTAIAGIFVALPLGIALVVSAVVLPLFAVPAFGPVLLRALPTANEAQATSLVARAIGQVSQAKDRVSWILEDRRLFVTWATFTLIVLALSALQVWLLAHGIADTVSPAEASFAFFACQLAGIASLLPLGLGAADGSLAALLRRFGLTFEQGAAAAVLLRMIVTIPFGIMAILCYVYLQRLSKSPQPEA